MKNFYVLKNEEETIIYEQKDFPVIMEKIKVDKSFKLKGFYDIESANIYAAIPCEKIYFVVKQKDVSIYFEKQKEMLEYIKDKKDFIVLSAKNKTRVDYLLNVDYELVLNQKNKKEIKKVEKEKKEKRALKKINKSLLSIEDKYIALIDCEASGNKAISIGIVIYNIEKGEIADTYYSLMCPKYFEKIDSYVERMIHLSTEDVLAAPTAKVVFEQVKDLLEKYNIKKIFTWGESDKRFIIAHECEVNVGFFSKKMCNIQKLVSLSVYHTTGNKQMGLSNMKKLYGISNTETSHNALEDAIDLANIFYCWWNNVDIVDCEAYSTTYTQKCANE